MIEFTLQKKLNANGGEMLLDVTASISPGDFVTLFGASGAGKTSILKMLAGLMQPEHGRVQVEDETWLNTGSKSNVQPQKRSVGFV